MTAHTTHDSAMTGARSNARHYRPSNNHTLTWLRLHNSTNCTPKRLNFACRSATPFVCHVMGLLINLMYQYDTNETLKCPQGKPTRAILTTSNVVLHVQYMSCTTQYTSRSFQMITVTVYSATVVTLPTGVVIMAQVPVHHIILCVLVHARQNNSVHAGQ